MSLISFLTSAVGGTLLGGVTQILGSGVKELVAWSESKRRIAEIVAIKEKNIAEGELAAFAKAQENNAVVSYNPPATAPSWMHGMFTIAAFCTQMVRPGMVLGACIYVWTRPPEVLGGLQSEILTFSFACGYFWLGVRHQMKKSS